MKKISCMQTQARTQVRAFHLIIKYARLNDLDHTDFPIYLAITLDRTLTYKQAEYRRNQKSCLGTTSLKP